MTELTAEPDRDVGGVSDKRLALWEIVSVVTSGLIAEWVVFSFVGRSKLVLAIPVLLALGLMVFSHRERGESLRDLGFRADNFLASCRELLLPTALALIAIVAAGWLISHAIFAGHIRVRYFSLPLWALFQQYARQRSEMARELQSEVRRLGGDPEKSGSIAGAAHRGWINIKSVVTGKDDNSIIAEAERGEDSAVKEYEDAMKVDLPAPLDDIISREYAEVKSAHDRIKSLRDATT